MLSRTKIPEIDSSYQEINVIICGNVDSGKSSFLGVISNPLLRDDLNELKSCLDDGNGLTRKSVLRLPHEQESGRTSSITYIPVVFKKHIWGIETSKVITFSDLCGHEKYLKTTIKGVLQPTNNYAIVCVENKIPSITLEHIGLLQIMKIPFSVVFTKCDLQVKDKLTKTFNSLNKLFNPYKKRLLPMTEKNIASEIDVSKYIPAFFISSKTGENILLFMKFLSQIKPKEIIHEYISIDNVFNVVGVGKVVTGYCGMEVNLHDKLYLGPSYDGSFTEITVRSIHDNYHNSIKSIKDKFGGFAIKLSKKMHIYKGTILSKTVLPVFETIKARIKIICLNVSISTGYNTTFCIQSASVSAKFVFDEPIIRSDKIWHDISITFLRPIFCQVNDKFVFREKKIIGYGIVL